MPSKVMKIRTDPAKIGRIGTAMLERLAELEPAAFSPETARIFLQLGFSEAEQRRVDQLSEKAQQGSLTADEGRELDEFIHLANRLAIVQSKSRLALKRAGLSA